MSKFYVYAHYTLDTNELFYIGKGKNKRAFSTLGRNKYWHDIVQKHNFRVEILIDTLTEDRAFIQEILAIKEFQPRANFTKGGAGGYTGPNSGNFKKGSKPWNTNKKCPEIGIRQRGSNNPMFGKAYPTKSVKCLELNKTYNSAKEVCKELKISKSGFFKSLQINRPIKGFTFQYV